VRHCVVSLIRYWSVGTRGGERVQAQMLHLYPQDDYSPKFLIRRD
jgi:hypothetical protein